MTYSINDKREALDREIELRRRVFPRLIAQGKMSEDAAARQIAIFEEIREDYVRLEQVERLL